MDSESGRDVVEAGDRTGTTSAAGAIGIGAAAFLALVGVIAAQLWQIGQPPLAGRINASPVTGFIAGPLELLAALAALGTLASLLSVAWGLSPSRTR